MYVLVTGERDKKYSIYLAGFSLNVKCWDLFAFFSDGLIDCEDPECCENPVCRKSQLCHTVPFPIDILLRKQPPSSTASFFERMKFIIEDKGLQSYVEKAGFNER